MTDRRLRVAIDARPLAEPPNGIRRWLEEILGPMVQVAPDIDWLLVTSKKGLVQPEGIDAEVAFASGSMRALLRPVWEVARLPGVLSRARADVLLSPYGVVPLRCAVPTVSVVHDLAFLKWPGMLPLRYRLYWRWVAATVGRAERIIVPSRSTRTVVVDRLDIDGDKVHIVPHAAGEVFVPGTPEGGDRIRRRFGLPEKYVLAVGTIEPRKNLRVLIEAMENVNRERVVPVRLVVAGRWGWGTTITSRPWIHHVEGADDHELAELYRGATVFAMPSLDEGFGLPALEAMACGAPVVVSNAGALPEVVGGAGITVDPADTEGWRKAICSLLDGTVDVNDFRSRSIERAESFSWASSAQDVAEILRNVSRTRATLSDGHSS